MLKEQEQLQPIRTTNSDDLTRGSKFKYQNPTTEKSNKKIFCFELVMYQLFNIYNLLKKQVTRILMHLYMHEALEA